jgi:nitroimidazol reductase NimA-like FMN-containing flavoprotein (pyridoxamine 5'-phosphate oxidase superfamily)
MGESKRLGERNVWVATVRPDGRPHLAPVWFVAHADRWYLVTAPDSVKARNLQQNPQISLALEDGDDPLVVEGQAQAVQPSAEVVRLFREKYDWDITVDSVYTQTIEVQVKKTRGGSANS